MPRRLLSRLFSRFTPTRPARPTSYRRTNKLALQPLEARCLLAITTFVNDDWALADDVDLSGDLTVGDLVESNETNMPGAPVAYGTVAFGTVGGVSVGGAATINDAIAATDVGGTVQVAAGFYNEDFIVNKHLTVNGAGDGVTANDTIIDAVTHGISIAGSGTAGNPLTVSNLRVQDGTRGVVFETAVAEVLLSNLTVTGHSSSNMEFRGGADITNLVMDNLDVHGSVGSGLRVAGAARADGWTISNSTFHDNLVGITAYIAEGSTGNEGSLNNVHFMDSSFSNNMNKGLYFEKLDNAVLERLTISGNGIDVPTDFVFDAGIDINLKGGNYANILIAESDFENNGVLDAGTGTGIWIKARNDGAYAANPATLVGVNVRFNQFTGNETALRIENAVSGANVSYNGFDNSVADGLVNVTASVVEAKANWWGDASGPTVLSNPEGTGETVTGLANASKWLIYGDDNAAQVGFQPVQTISVQAVTSDFSATLNNYTILANVIDTLLDGQTVDLSGDFDWREPFAAASWALGNDCVAGTDDDYTLAVRGGLHNVTLTSTLSDATIQGPGDLATVNLESFLTFSGGAAASDDNQNWTISNLQILDFDLGIGMFNSGAGINAFEGTTITGNHIRVATDLNATVAPIDSNQNIGIHYSFGDNQTISFNTIEIPGDGISDLANSKLATSVGMQSNTSGGAYEGLVVQGNTITVLHAANAANPEQIRGFWENGHGHTKNIQVTDNSFINADLNNDPASNNQTAFIITSHSGLTSTVNYSGNYVQGANVGMLWLAGSNFAAHQAVQVWNNTFEDNRTSILIQSNGIANLVGNVIENSGAGGGVRIVTGRLAGSGGYSEGATENVITGGAGHGIVIEAGAGTIAPISGNYIAGNAGFGIENQSATVVDAAGNYWGVNSPLDVAAEVSANVDYSPWLDSGVDDDADPLNGFQATYDLVHVDDNSPRADSNLAYIQKALDLVAAKTMGGTTILVHDGLYLGSHVINQSVVIMGESEAGVVVAPVAEDANVNDTYTGAQHGFLVNASDVTIRDLTIDGQGNAALTLGKNNFRNGVVTKRDAIVTEIDNLLVDNLTIQNIYRRGIQVYNPGSGNVISNNVIDGIEVAGSGYGIVVFEGDTEVLSNVISNAHAGIGSNYVSGPANAPLLVVQGNQISDVNSGLGLSGLAEGSLIGGPNASDANTIDLVGGSAGIGITVQYSVGQVTVENNTITGDDTDAGIWLFHNEESTLPVIVKDNNLTSSNSVLGTAGRGVGIFMTDNGDLFGDEDGDSYATIVGNTISGFARGIELSRDGNSPVSGRNVWATIGGTGVDDGNTIDGGVTGIRVYELNGGADGFKAQATIIGNSITDSEIGVDVDGGLALLQDNDLNGHSDTALLVQRGAVVDAGQFAVGGIDFTGLGISTGGNDFSGYALLGPAMLIRNLNADAVTGPAGDPADVTAVNNLLPSDDLAEIEALIDHDTDDSLLGFVNFGNLDFGDAADPTFPTLAASNGAVHVLGSGLYLGSEVNGEADGQPAADAAADLSDDGVAFVNLTPGATVDITVNASAAGLLNAWFDFNGDGDWDDVGEQVFTDEALVAGSNVLSLAVPNVSTGPVTARFRLSSDVGLGYDGLASDGEVEDYVVYVNNAPVAVDDAYDTTEDDVLTIDLAIGVLDNDTDLDGDTLVVTGSPLLSTLGAIVSMNPDGSFSYDPTASATLQALKAGQFLEDTFIYAISDGKGGFASAEVTITVNGVNDAPVATDDDVITQEDLAVDIAIADLLSNDSDADQGDTFALESFTQPANGVVHDDGNGNLVYTPLDGFFGTDSFTYTILGNDGGMDTATVTIEVQEIPNIPPVAQADGFIIADGAGQLVVTDSVLDNDSDADNDTIFAELLTTTTKGVLVFETDGTFTYTPGDDFDGFDSFTYRAIDGGDASAAVTVTIESQSYNFVSNLYTDVLDRAGDAAGIQFWLDALEDGTSRLSVIESFLQSTEYLELTVNKLYQQLLGRAAEQAGLDFWVAQLQSGVREETVLASIAGSAEYFDVHGGTNEGFVEALYQDLLGRAAEPAGLEFWTDLLDGGTSRVAVGLSIASSNEFRGLLLSDPADNFAAIEGWYQDFLNRDADAGGSQFWLDQFAAGATWSDVQTGLLASDEYFNQA